MTDLALEICGLDVRFSSPRGSVSVLRGVSLTVEPGTTLALIGESGSGKSMTARAVMGLLPPGIASATGSIRVAGHQMIGPPERSLRAVRGRHVSMVFQDPVRSLNPTMRVGHHLVEAIRSHDRTVTKSDARKRACELLELVRLSDPTGRMKSYPSELSGGMAQRVMIAIAISANPKLLIADEPTTALDVTTQAQILQLLDDLRRDLGMAVLLITHDMSIAADHAQQVAVMYAGHIVESGPARSVMNHPSMPYTHALQRANPSAVSRTAMLTAIPGGPPDPNMLPRGCTFAPRCARVQPACGSAEPPLEQIGPKHAAACWFPLQKGS